MLTRSLIIANIALAVALAWFVYSMLPFAAGVACDGARAIGRACADHTGPVERALSAALPIFIIIGFVFFGLRARTRRITLIFLLACPFAAAVLALQAMITGL